MNIAFDSVAILGPMSKNRGIGNYADSQFRTLISQDQENNYFFFNVFEDQGYFQNEEKQGKITEEDFLCVKNQQFFNVPWFDKCYGELVQKYIQKNNIDVFYITSPFDDHVPPYKQEWFEDTTVVVTVYDIIPYVMKEHYFPHKGDIDWYMERIEMLRWADRLLVISQSVKDDLVNYLHFDPKKIDVIWGAPSNMFKKVDITQPDEKQLRNKFNIHDSFVMCTGGDDERKNIAGLIEAYSKMSSDLIRQFQLVVVCKLQQASVERYTNLARENGVGDRVVLTNFVTNDELVKLYNLAELVAFPSVYEGFGLPVVEAWACGTGVLTSNDSSLGQIAGDAAITVNPHSVSDITKGLEKALRGDLENLAKAGEKRLPMFTWENVADDTKKSIEQAASEKKHMNSIKPTSRKRIAFFTPLPPLESGIADYSVDIINALIDFFDIDVYIDDGYKPDQLLDERVRILSHKKFNGNRNQYNETVFQMGNSLFHDYMWPYVTKHGGLVVLHDYNMHGVIQAKMLGLQNKPEEYRKVLLCDLAEKEVKECMDAVGSWKRLDTIRTKIELNGFLINHADKIIVHSDEAKRKLLEKDISRSVRRIRHYAKIEPLADVRKAKKEIGIDPDTVVLAAFGGIHQTKRAVPILRAFARLHSEFDQVQLVFSGKLDSSLEDEFNKTVRELHLQDSVMVTGYQDLDTFLKYMDATDICLNLRWPYNGETSGSLMRMLAKGKCIIVNDIGSFSEIPDEAIVKLPSVEYLTSEQETSIIYDALYNLCKNEEARRYISESARKYAEAELDLDIIAKQYTAYISEKPEKLINQNLLTALSEDTDRLQMNRQEVLRLAHTLAYIK